MTWLERGPTPEEKLAAYNGPILREKIQEHFGRLYSLNGVYVLLHRLMVLDRAGWRTAGALAHRSNNETAALTR